MLRRIALIVIGLFALAWVAGSIILAVNPPKPQPVAVAITATAIPAPTQTVLSRSTPQPTATTVRAVPSLPVAMTGYSIVAVVDRNNRLQPGRQRYLVEIDVPATTGREQMTAALRDAVRWSFATLPAIRTVVVQSFLTPRNPVGGWTGQAFASQDGRDWANEAADNGQLHITYSPIDGPTAEFDVPR